MGERDQSLLPQPQGAPVRIARPSPRPWFAVAGVLWQSALIYGLARFFVLLAGTFEAISASGNTDPKVMADGIGKALVPVVFWGAVGVFGLLTTLITMLVSRYRARWWFWTSWVFAAIYLLFVPVGTVLSIALIVVLAVKRREFLGPLDRAVPAA